MPIQSQNKNTSKKIWLESLPLVVVKQNLSYSMWGFLWYMSRESSLKVLSQDFLKMIGAQASKTVLKMSYKFSLIYLGIRNVAVEIIVIERLAFGGLMSWLDNSSSNLKSGEESKRATKEPSL